MGRNKVSRCLKDMIMLYSLTLCWERKQSKLQLQEYQTSPLNFIFLPMFCWYFREHIFNAFMLWFNRNLLAPQAEHVILMRSPDLSILMRSPDLSKTHMPNYTVVCSIVFVYESVEFGKGVAHKHFVQSCSCLNILKCSKQNIV